MRKKTKKVTGNRKGYIVAIYSMTCRPAILRQDARDYDNDGLSFQFTRTGTIFRTKAIATARGRRYCKAYAKVLKKTSPKTPAPRFSVLPVGFEETMAV